jgi:type IV secretory pathway VirB2 component (pilin)
LLGLARIVVASKSVGVDSVLVKVAKSLTGLIAKAVVVDVNDIYT